MPLIRTVKELCRVCYTCVRECPAKAIRIVDGQAEIIRERCIGCGNCVRVCSQNAKQVVSSIPIVEMFLGADEPVAACFAPSFAAEFAHTDYQHVVGMARATGFTYVNEVAFGADLVAAEYRELLRAEPDGRYIATTCPAVALFVEKYHPGLVDNLAPIVSPMVALARVLKHLHGPTLRIVFIGPCIAKKAEAADVSVEGEIDAVLTFAEFRQMLEERRITTASVTPGEFDPPRAGTGALFPVSRGLLQAAEIGEDLVQADVVAADGRTSFVSALKEFEAGDMDVRLLETLACHGCIMGAGMTTLESLFRRRNAVSRYVRSRLSDLDTKAWIAEVKELLNLDMSRSFIREDRRIADPTREELKTILARMGKYRAEDELNCGACGYDTCVEHAVAIFKGLAESEMCLPYTIEKLHRTVEELGVSNEKLASTQEALIQSEKLASMGQLAAGIAHEVNNPLGVVLMYAHILLEEVDEADLKLKSDLSLIVEQADRCKKIVSGLLQFARQNKTVRQNTDVCNMVNESLRSIPVPDGVEIVIQHNMDNCEAEIDRDQIVQVLANLVSNAYAAMPDGGTLNVQTSSNGDRVVIQVTDCGTGIPEGNLKKVFEPFYTTKQIGQGTGLGLAVSYGIVKMHRGDISVKSNANPDAGPTGTTFTVSLPRGSELG